MKKEAPKYQPPIKTMAYCLLSNNNNNNSYLILVQSAEWIEENLRLRCVKTGLRLEDADMETNANLPMEIKK
jgi:hypothetical protein